MIEPRSWLLSNVLRPGLGTCLYSRAAHSHLCAFGDPIKHVMPIDIPGRSHFGVHLQQMVEMQKKLVQRGDEIAAVIHRHSGEQVEGGEELAKLKRCAGLGTNIYSINVFVYSFSNEIRKLFWMMGEVGTWSSLPAGAREQTEHF